MGRLSCDICQPSDALHRGGLERSIHARPQQRHIELKQHLVDFKDVEVAPFDEILQNDIELATVGEGKSGLAQQCFCLRKGEFQSNSKGKHSGLAGLVGGIGTNLTEQLSVYVGIFGSYDWC